jgi:hypothetical protein
MSAVVFKLTAFTVPTDGNTIGVGAGAGSGAGPGAGAGGEAGETITADDEGSLTTAAEISPELPPHPAITTGLAAAAFRKSRLFIPNPCNLSSALRKISPVKY